MARLSPTTETPEQIKWRKYEAHCETVMRKSSNLRWKQGMLADYGERVFPETYMQAMSGKFGLSQGTIENRMRVYRRFPTKNERLWDVDFMWYETLQAKDWDTICEYMDKIEAGEYENREQLRAEFRTDKTMPKKTICKLENIIAVLTSPEFGFSEDDMIDITAKLAKAPKDNNVIEGDFKVAELENVA